MAESGEKLVTNTMSDFTMSQCVFCKHAYAGNKCAAFPDSEIPDDILLNEFIHDHKHPLQENDIVYAKRDNIQIPVVIEKLT